MLTAPWLKSPGRECYTRVPSKPHMSINFTGKRLKFSIQRPSTSILNALRVNSENTWCIEVLPSPICIRWEQDLLKSSFVDGNNWNIRRMPPGKYISVSLLALMWNCEIALFFLASWFLIQRVRNRDIIQRLFWFRITCIRPRVFSRCRSNCCLQRACQSF